MCLKNFISRTCKNIIKRDLIYKTNKRLNDLPITVNYSKRSNLPTVEIIYNQFDDQIQI